MALSDGTRRALRAYDSFTDFARCPDLPWSPDAYERLDDEVAQTMLRAFCYAWAASQQAAGVYGGPVADLADNLFDALPSWDVSLPHQHKLEWTLGLGVKLVLLQLDARPVEAPACQQPAELAAMSSADRDAVEDMAAFFQIERDEATLLFRIGRALGKAPPALQAEAGSSRR
jgi:hypothetical protein